MHADEQSNPGTDLRSRTYCSFCDMFDYISMKACTGSGHSKRGSEPGQWIMADIALPSVSQPFLIASAHSFLRNALLMETEGGYTSSLQACGLL